MIDWNKINHNCPCCSNPTIFKSTKGDYYCINCGNDLIVKDEILQLKNPLEKNEITPESKTDAILDPEILIQ